MLFTAFPSISESRIYNGEELLIVFRMKNRWIIFLFFSFIKLRQISTRNYAFNQVNLRSRKQSSRLGHSDVRKRTILIKNKYRTSILGPIRPVKAIGL